MSGNKKEQYDTTWLIIYENYYNTSGLKKYKKKGKKSSCKYRVASKRRTMDFGRQTQITHPNSKAIREEARKYFQLPPAS